MNNLGAILFLVLALIAMVMLNLAQQGQLMAIQTMYEAILQQGCTHE